MSSATRPSLELRRVDPLAHADAIKSLFGAHDREDFADYFDRAYPDAVSEGASSWIAVDESGNVSIHLARFPHLFNLDGGQANGGLLVNLMTAREHRSFFPTLRVIKQLINDSRADGDIDFLYADPNDQSRPLIKAAGFTPIGELERFVLPLRDARWYVDLGVRVYHFVLRALRWRGGARVSRRVANAVDTSALEVPPGVSSDIRPWRPPSLYRRRLADYPGPRDQWYLIEHAGGSAAVLVRDGDDGSALLCSVHRTVGMPLATLIPPLARELRRAGFRTAWLWTIAGSRFAGELQRVGFRRREERLPIFGLPLTPLGERVLAAVADWETTHLDWDR
jgi:hypothetical protein